ncbi:hypothetical protein ES703_120071 [subsurface metagenome]
MRNKFLITILIIILVVVYSLLGLDYIKQQPEQAVLINRISDTGQALAQLPEPPPDLDGKLAVAEAKFSAAQNSFPAELNSTQFINYIIKLAERYHVTVIPLSTDAWSTQTFRNYDYNILRLDVAVSGSYPQLVSFISKLEDGDYRTLVIEDVILTGITEQADAAGDNTETGEVKGNLQLAIYTQPYPEAKAGKDEG